MNLHVVSNNKFEKVMKSSCVVKIDDTISTYSEFVTVGVDENGLSLSYLADALTLGQAMMMIHNAFAKEYEKLTPEIQRLVDSALSKGGK